MHFFFRNMTMTALGWAMIHGMTVALEAQPAVIEPDGLVGANPPPQESPDPSATNAHLRLCAMLGLKEGRTYMFRIASTDNVHYWTVRSLGARGWILARDSYTTETWVNLSQVISVTPIASRTSAERPAKPNRAR